MAIKILSGSKIKVLTIIILLFSSCVSSVQKMNLSNNTFQIIPKPASVTLRKGKMDLKSITAITLKHNSKSEEFIAQLFQDFLEPVRMIDVSQFKDSESNQIIIDLDLEYPIPHEGYNLSIGENQSIILKAASPSGLFYGFQTFRQICDSKLDAGERPNILTISNCNIVDSPQFRYRGMHLDVSRHFFDMEFVKTYINMIALHKMNVFHWHLTDDNGWRIEIKQYPKLTEQSAWRVDRRQEPWKEWSPIQPDEKATYGGFYTQDEIREVIQYAADRNIMVIPEIEMPGHTSEVFAAYPDLSCKGEFIPVNPGSYWPNVDIFCAGNDDVFIFLENVLEEVVELFPGSYIHIGGDEAEKTYWKTCPKCQKRIKDEGLKDEHELQSWFIKKIENFILLKNKKLVGWDEILEGGLAKSATVMSWRGMKGGIESAKAGHDVIMCPTSHCYFDYYQADPETSPEAIGGYTTLKKVYSFNPVPEELSQKESNFVLGAQGNLWTEYVQEPDLAQYRVLPRMTALSEVLWSGPGKNSYGDFFSRLIHLYDRFDVLGWTYAPGSFVVSIQADQKKIGMGFRVNLTSEKPGQSIRFTIDGSEPSIDSPLFNEPFSINRTTTVKTALFINGKQAGQTTKKTFHFHKAVGKDVQYAISHKQKYSGAGPFTLVDGLTGTTSYNDGYWQGWEADNMDVVIDLQNTEKITQVSVGLLESHQSWIFLPTYVKFSFSDDGKDFQNEKTVALNDGERNGKPNRRVAEISNIGYPSRFIRVQAINRKICPEWHLGGGGKAWIFSDEIVVE